MGPHNHPLLPPCLAAEQEEGNQRSEQNSRLVSSGYHQVHRFLLLLRRVVHPVSRLVRSKQTGEIPSGNQSRRRHFGPLRFCDDCALPQDALHVRQQETHPAAER